MARALRFAVGLLLITSGVALAAIGSVALGCILVAIGVFGLPWFMRTWA